MSRMVLDQSNSTTEGGVLRGKEDSTILVQEPLQMGANGGSQRFGRYWWLHWQKWCQHAITCTLHLHQGGENEQALKIQEADYSSGGDLRGKEEHHLVLMLAPGEKRLEVDHSSGAATSLWCIKLTTCHPLPPNQCLHHRFHQISLYQSNAVYCNYKLCIFIFTFLLFINPSLSFRWIDPDFKV